MVSLCFCELLWSTLSIQEVGTTNMGSDFKHKQGNFQDLCLLCSLKPYPSHFMSLILPAAGTKLFPGLASEDGLSRVSLHPLDWSATPQLLFV